ncbi:MAG: recombinase family protein [Clostridia bacterium]|nr:recombinase family protein [Clostridia bacterium]
MDQRIWGYVRVSTQSQNYEYQERILLSTGLKFNHIYHEKQTGKNFNRIQYNAMISAASKGDLIVFSSLDRMGRNYNQIIEQWNFITKSKGCDIKIVDMDLLDTSKGNGSLTGQFIGDLVLQILSYVAEVERQKIQNRVKQGLDNARSKGVKLGRPSVKLDKDQVPIVQKYLNNQLSAKEAMEILRLKKSTFYKLMKEYKFKDKK